MQPVSRGFTLLEVLIVAALISVLTLLSLPSFTAFGERNARTAAINHLYSTFAFARQLAISEQTSVSVCATNQARSSCLNGWHGDIMVMIGDNYSAVQHKNIVRIVPALPSTRIRYTREGHRRAVKFNPLGFSKGYNGRFHICPTGAETGSTLVLSQYGRLRLDDQAHACL
ncbi:MAG: GspH/FimT family pseudopilin [Pseudomonadota bacterium]|jgi:type IV fimbrial biogenesis protein FimT